MKKYVCVHGHFYQPPRENPWTGEVDPEKSARPFHDWNERIAKECYEPNVRAPILNAKGQVMARVNNYENISFDFGPTLLSWMRRKIPSTYKMIVEADRQSAQKRGGHGNAMAQAYNHIIMPLAKKRDKLTQILWGIRDFEFHYKRRPEGMWLPESAVDRETLTLMAEQGIEYSVLCPRQAYRTRRIGFGRRWQSLRGESIDPRHAYRIILDRGKQFHLFFYDAPISRAIAFEGLLFNGDALNQRLLNAAGHNEPHPLVITATDGESFGHHHRLGEMAIAYALTKLEDLHMAELTNFGEHLDRFGSQWEVDIYENSSWSCSHGVERWRSDCGCRINHQAGWNQRWRSVLREAFEFLQRVIDDVFEERMTPLLKNPWNARNEYIDVVLDPSAAQKKRFLQRHVKRPLLPDFEEKVWDLLEAERFSMLMFTSCGWFFDDISGIEPVQNMKFALRAIELVRPYSSESVEETFSQILHHAKSNYPEQGTGADVFRRYVKPIQEQAAQGKKAKD